MAYGGLKSIESEMSATVSNQEAGGAKIKDAMRSYAQQGYKLVFGHGFEYNEPAIEVAKDFPDTVFVSSSGGKTAPNVGAFRFYLEQGFYVAGYLAGLSSKSSVVAMIGGDDVPSIRSTFKAFKAGALFANPKTVVKEIFTGSGQDDAKAKLATLTAIQEGADFVIHQANAAADGVFAACKEKGVWAFGANLDQNTDPSGIIIGSAVINAKPAILKLAQRVASGSFKGEIVLMGMEDDAIDFILNGEKTATLPEGVVEKVIKLRDDIKAGVKIVPKDDF
jgi:basic membrane lipoprotein Med (substrate-binding protein (PBP1-ABC) superfamily)